jgi:hypothetical protein
MDDRESDPRILAVELGNKRLAVVRQIEPSDNLVALDDHAPQGWSAHWIRHGTAAVNVVVATGVVGLGTSSTAAKDEK